MIVLILITIAVPYLGGCIARANVTRSRQEVDTVLVALELYFADWNVYPFDHHGDWPYQNPDDSGFVLLTTPTKYLTHLLRDPFGPHQANNPALQGIPSSYYGGSGSDNTACGGRHHYSNSFLLRNDRNCVHAYLVFGIGPDGERSTRDYRAFPLGESRHSYPVTIKSYSPTNGTRSRGDVHVMTGAWTAGSVMINGRMASHH